MKYKSTYGLMAMMAMTLLTLLSTSCGSKPHSLLDMVPSASPIVATIDLEAVLKQAGCDMSGDSVRYTPELTSLIADKRTGTMPAPIKILSRLYGVADMTSVVMFNIENNDNVFAIDITDLETFYTTIADFAEPASRTEELELYSIDNWSMAVAAGYAWFAAKTPAELSDIVTPLLSLDQTESISKLTGVADFLTDGMTVSIAMRPSAISPISTDCNISHWSCMSLRIEDSVIGADLCMMDGDGKILPIATGMQEIDTDFLRYVPQSFVLAAAAGFTPQFKWKELTSLTTLILGPSNASYISTAAQLLSKIDGTVAFAAGPASGAPALANIGPATWDLLFMVHMPQADIDNTLTMLQTYGSMAGLKMESGHDNITEATLPDGTKIYAGNVDGYLAVSNREFDGGNSNSMTDVFLLKQAAMTINLPADGEVVKTFGLPYGFDFSVQMSADNVHARMSLNGTDKRVLQSIINMLSR